MAEDEGGDLNSRSATVLGHQPEVQDQTEFADGGNRAEANEVDADVEELFSLEDFFGAFDDFLVAESSNSHECGFTGKVTASAPAPSERGHPDMLHGTFSIHLHCLDVP